MLFREMWQNFTKKVKVGIGVGQVPEVTEEKRWYGCTEEERLALVQLARSDGWKVLRHLIDDRATGWMRAIVQQAGSVEAIRYSGQLVGVWDLLLLVEGAEGFGESVRQEAERLLQIKREWEDAGVGLMYGTPFRSRRDKT